MDVWPQSDDFLLGAATAAFQVEGGLDTISDYGVYAAVPDGPFVTPAGAAVDHYNLFAQDIGILADLGLDTYRFSIEWARIQPDADTFSPEAVDHYAQVLQVCRANGIRPVVTLQHFTAPKWLISRGGWEWSGTPAYFATYAAHIASELGSLIKGEPTQPTGAICTLNEVNTGRLNHGDYGPPEIRRKSPWAREAAEALGIHPDRFTPWTFASSQGAFDVIMECHFGAVRALQVSLPGVPVGLTIASQAVEATAEEFEEQAGRMSNFLEDQFLKALDHDRPDSGQFVGVQAYKRTHIGRRSDGHVGPVPPLLGTRLVELGYEYAPEAVGDCIRHTRDLTGLPILVSECGIGTHNDPERIEYYQRALQSIAGCIADGIDVKGMLAWSLLDNYEWEHSFRPKFGLIDVDRQTQSRSVKPSGFALKRIAEENGLCS